MYFTTVYWWLNAKGFYLVVLLRTFGFTPSMCTYIRRTIQYIVWNIEQNTCKLHHYSWNYSTYYIYKIYVCSFSSDIFSGRLLSVLRGHSVFSSPPQRPMTSDFEGFSIPDFIHYIYVPILILEKEPVFPFWMFSAKQGHYLYPFYNVSGMTRSLTGDWTRDVPHSKPALYH